MPISRDAVPHLVSPKIYDHILASPNLERRLLPEGSHSSGYETIDYQATLILNEPGGREAMFCRTERVRFLQEGVTAIMDHYWGDGVPMTYYNNSAGQLAESFQEDGRRHLVIDLPRVMHRSETLTFDVERLAMAGFAGDEEWLETAIDRPVHHFGQQIVFPGDRPCQEAELVVSNCVVPLKPVTVDDGRTMLRFDVPQPDVNTPYLVRWYW